MTTENDRYSEFRTELSDLCKELSALFITATTIPGFSGQAFTDWEKSLSGIMKKVSSDVLKVATVGAIKSGKSTFVNSIFRGDHLKRGAGVVTSFVTRMGKSSENRAVLTFKSLDEVNADIEQATVLLPGFRLNENARQVDITNFYLRDLLEKSLAGLTADELITEDARSLNSVLLSSYVNGYDQIKSQLPQKVLILDGNMIAKHKDYVGDETLAVFLKDVELRLDTGAIGEGVEIADCQGSDSPNPLHLALIQDYLVTAHIMIYVVSSRTGLRRADIRFLNMLRKMGMSENLIFMVNVDINEHESVESLKALIARITEEIAIIKPDPEVYAYSALLNLFRDTRAELTTKDRKKLELWDSDLDFVEFSDEGAEVFTKSFLKKLSGRRYELLLKDRLGRINVITAGMRQWILINKDLVSGNGGLSEDLLNRVRSHQAKMTQIKQMVKNALDGTAMQLKKEISRESDKFFDRRDGETIRDLAVFIGNYGFAKEKYESDVNPKNFYSTLYYVYQEFKQALDNYMAETVNPRIIRHVSEKEKKIKAVLESNIEPFDVMVKDAIFGYYSAVDPDNSLNIAESTNGAEATEEAVSLNDLEPLKNALDIRLPAATAVMRYSARIKTEAVLKLGYYSFVRVVRKMMKQPIQNDRKDEVMALDDGVKQMKKETLGSVLYHMKDYQENLKFQYFHRLIDACTESLYESLLDRFQAYATDLTEIAGLINRRQIDKERAEDILKGMEISARKIQERLLVVQNEIRSGA